MKVYLDRTLCPACSAYSDRHSAKLVRFPEGEDRACITAVEDDGRPLLTLDVTDGKNHATVTLTEAQRAQAAYEGLTPLLPWFQH